MNKQSIQYLLKRANVCARCKEPFGLLQVRVLIQKSKQVVCESCDT